MTVSPATLQLLEPYVAALGKRESEEAFVALRRSTPALVRNHEPGLHAYWESKSDGLSMVLDEDEVSHSLGAVHFHGAGHEGFAAFPHAIDVAFGTPLEQARAMLSATEEGGGGYSSLLRAERHKWLRVALTPSATLTYSFSPKTGRLELVTLSLGETA